MPRNLRSIIEHSDELAARFESAEPNPLNETSHDVAVEVRDAVIERGRAEARVVAAVGRARAEGVSWTVLATVLGVSKQAARDRYGKLIDE